MVAKMNQTKLPSAVTEGCLYVTKHTVNYYKMPYVSVKVYGCKEESTLVQGSEERGRRVSE